jgi:hypothetical protein
MAMLDYSMEQHKSIMACTCSQMNMNEAQANPTSNKHLRQRAPWAIPALCFHLTHSHWLHDISYT